MGARFRLCAELISGPGTLPYADTAAACAAEETKRDLLQEGLGHVAAGDSEVEGNIDSNVDSDSAGEVDGEVGGEVDSNPPDSPGMCS